MKVIVGLGNPGEKYRYNRHNVGFMVVDRLRQNGQCKVQNQDGIFQFNKKFNAQILQTKEYILVKPQTYMNNSGEAVAKICHFYKVKYEDLYVIHDDLDIQLGNFKIQQGKGPKVHNGLKSVEEQLGTEKFWNVRVGVENREIRGNKGVPGVVYSLQDFRREEREILDGVIENICKELRNILQVLQGPTS